MEEWEVAEKRAMLPLKAYAVVVTAALLLAVIYIWLQDREAQERSATQQKAAIASSLEEQKTCADQAKKNFVDGGWRLDGGAVNGVMGSYTDHYAPAINKCFFQLYTIGGTPNPVMSYIVFDAFEAKEYAHYTTMYFPDNKRTVVMECDVTIPSQPRQLCKSKDEWDRIVQPLMGSD